MKISVVMSVNNGEKYLTQAIDSILNQTLKDFEFIIIDDGSDDNTENIIKSYEDTRIKYFYNKNKFGLTKSLNICLKIANGQYIARMDADDISMPDRLELQYNFMEENTRFGLIGSCAEAINEKGEFVYDIIKPQDDRLIKYSLYHFTPFLHSAIFFRKKIIKDVNYYNEEYEYAQDYDLYFRLSRLTSFSNLQEKLLQYRVHRQSRSHNPSESRKQAKCAIEILYKNISRIVDITPAQAESFYKINNFKNVSWLAFFKYFYIYRKLLRRSLKTTNNKFLHNEIEKIYFKYFKRYLKYKTKLFLNFKND